MPGGDRTGPQGMGSMTGRAAGYCVGSNVPGNMNPSGGRGMALRRGRLHGGGGGFGRGRGFSYYGAPAVPGAVPVAPIVPQPLYGTVPIDEGMELETLRGQARELEASMSGIQKRIEELEAKNSETKEE